MNEHRKIILKSGLCPGDILMMTAAIRDLHKSCPNQFITDVRTLYPDIWLNNPYISSLQDSDGEMIEFRCDLIHKCNSAPYHYIHAYAQFLESVLNVKIPLTEFRGDIHLSAEEKEMVPQVEGKFWIIVAGGKYDFSSKWWNPYYYQEVVDHFKGKITFVQVGQLGDFHPKLKNVIDLIGKTDTRQFLRLVYHSTGIICPVTYAMHAAAAVPFKTNSRGCVVIAGAREPVQWEMYPNHRYLSTNGYLSCSKVSDSNLGGCWCSRCQRVGDKDEKDRVNVCKNPVLVNSRLCIPKCMDMIKPKDVIREIERYYEGDLF